MRFPFLSTLALLACSAFTAAAHADTFSFALTPTGGTTTTYTVDSAAGQGDSDYDIKWSDATIQGWQAGQPDESFFIYNTGFASAFGYGALDLIWDDANGSVYYGGPQLFSVTNTPTSLVTTILTGTYQLTANQSSDYSGTIATLVITDLSTQVAATPEPSSLILLGTGLVGAAGMARRRFLAA